METHDQNNTYSHPVSVTTDDGVVYNSTKDVPVGTPLNSEYWELSNS